MAEALRSAWRAEILQQPAPTRDEVNEALLASGRDPEGVAQQYKDMIDAKLRAARKGRLQELRSKAASGQPLVPRARPERRPRALPPLEVIRSRIDALSTKPQYKKLLLAYRNGTVQSESDLETLYEDLLELGVLSDDAED
ncbi:hypothetical protein GCM10027321_28260 [Massilia terrae]